MCHFRRLTEGDPRGGGRERSAQLNIDKLPWEGKCENGYQRVSDNVQEVWGQSHVGYS